MSPAEFRDLRRSIGMTQRQLSKRLDMGVNIVTSLEQSGETIPLRYEFALRWIVLCESENRAAKLKAEAVG